MFPINFNFPYRKKDGSVITMEKALDGAGADLDLIDLDDVAITTPADGDGLIYNNTAQKWKNIPIISRILTLFNAWKNNGAYNVLENKGVSQELGGISFSVSGGITTAVVPSEDHAANFDIVPSTDKITLPAGTYKLICLSSSAQDIYCQGFGDHDYTSGLGIIDTGDGVVFTLTQENELYFFIHIGATANAGTYTFKPMITTDLNATYADYVPYAMTNAEITDKGVFRLGNDPLKETKIFDITVAALDMGDTSAVKTFLSDYTGHNYLGTNIISLRSNSNGQRATFIISNSDEYSMAIMVSFYSRYMGGVMGDAVIAAFWRYGTEWYYAPVNATWTQLS